MSKKKTKKKTSKKLVKVDSPVKKDEAFFVASELADDKLIEQEVLGQATKTMVYEYENEDGQMVYGLSYQGVREVVRMLNRKRDSGHRIQISDKAPRFTQETYQGVEGIEVQVYAQDVESGGGYWGVKFEPWYKGITGASEVNRFAKEIALSKAERNALFKLLPLDIIESMIAKFSKDAENVKKIEAPKTTERTVTPKKTDDDKMYKATLEQVGKIQKQKKALEDTLKNVDKLPISGKQRGQIKRKIKTYLKKL